MKLEAKRIVKEGRTMYQVDIPAGALGGRKKGGVRTKVCRTTPEEAVFAARIKIEEHHRHGVERANLTADERDFIYKWRGKLDLKGMDDACEAARVRASVTVDEAKTRYLATPREAPLSKEYLGSLKPRLNKFASAFPGRAIGSMTSGELQAFIREQGASAPDYFSNLRALFRFAFLHEWVAKNPMDRVPRPAPAVVDKELFAPAAMAAMLRLCAIGGEREENGAAVKFAPSPALLRYLVLGGFCGLRHTESIRLLSDAVREDFEIHIRKMKTSKRGIRERYVQPEEPALTWLKWLVGKPSGLRFSKTKGAPKFIGLNDANLRRHRNEMLAFLNAEWVENGLRRSFGSYHLAARQDAAKTAEIMGHTDAETTKAKYRVPRRMEVALEWFALTPESVLK